MINSSIRVETSMASIAESLDAEQALELINAVDEYQVDWDFTEKVARHFVKTMLQFTAEDGEGFREWLREISL